MRAALSARPDIHHVQTFYPFHYSHFTETPWHLVLIEGWFPSIHSFISLARANNPGVVVLFFCLDPAYPGMPRVHALDVDGFLTNSRSLLSGLRRRRPAVYVPLAADTEVRAGDGGDGGGGGGVVVIVCVIATARNTPLLSMMYLFLYVSLSISLCHCYVCMHKLCNTCDHHNTAYAARCECHPGVRRGVRGRGQ
jgi:hypothetical protein